jgi:hypothetical protein
MTDNVNTEVLHNHPPPWTVGECNEARAAIWAGGHEVCTVRPALAFGNGAWSPEVLAQAICSAVNGDLLFPEAPVDMMEMIDVLIELPSGIKVPSKYPRHLVMSR